MQKTACKNSKHSRNETTLKIDHFGKSIAHAKWPIYFQLFFLQKDAQNDYTRTTELFCAKKTLAKTPTSREMRP